jgi:hypothetical protein
MVVVPAVVSTVVVAAVAIVKKQAEAWRRTRIPTDSFPPPHSFNLLQQFYTPGEGGICSE